MVGYLFEKKNNKGKNIKANNTDLAANSNHRCCAERRLLEHWEGEARRHGVPTHKVVTWGSDACWAKSL
ncbi:hypothetical protein WJX72_008439 [[Myrmecia] bisecta]|uniref:Uncharacterized protein n=1 Tax=[Myrmecia] bisecta TaxID=41462 RepID=A0AAW1PNW4_9CHLO